MTDYFVDKLPSNHAIRTITRAAAGASLKSEPLVVMAPDQTVPLVRRQCAAVAWLRSDLCKEDNIVKMPASERAFLLKLCGLLAGGNFNAQARRILEHVAKHSGDGGSSSAVGGGVVAGGAGFSAGGGGSSSGGGPSAASAGGSGTPLSSALLPSAQEAALNLLGRPELVRLLDAAGVPHDSAQGVAVLRDKCSAAAWAAEKLRSPHEVRALSGTTPTRIISAFGIHTAWKPEAQDRALDAILRECRNSSWGLDPASAHGIVCATRSTIFRLTERATLPDHQSASSRLDSHLSADELSHMSAQLGPVGFSLDDIQVTDGRWALRQKPSASASVPSTAPSAQTSFKIAALEQQLRTLHLEPYTWLTVDERKDIASRSKTGGAGKRKAPAFPGDQVTDGDDAVANPFSEWPWQQQLLVRPADTYSLLGRILRHALSWCNRHFTESLTKLAHQQRQERQRVIYSDFMDAVADHQHDRALLVTTQALDEAREEMDTILAHAQQMSAAYPSSDLFKHVEERRMAQLAELKVFLADVNARVTFASKQRMSDGQTPTQRAVAAWFDFLDGWLGNIDKELVRPEALRLTAGGPAASTPNALPPPQAAVTRTNTVTTGATTPAAKRQAAGGGGSGTVASSSSSLPTRGRTCSFQRNFPVSPTIVGATLGVISAPQCKICTLSDHYHGECPLECGKIGKPLPGFTRDGTRIGSMWHSKSNEPLQKTMKAWVAFLSDMSNFVIPSPLPAEVAGAPTLADFQARVATAPARP